jgi:hypothetical protein
MNFQRRLGADALGTSRPATSAQGSSKGAKAMFLIILILVIIIAAALMLRRRYHH